MDFNEQNLDSAGSLAEYYSASRFFQFNFQWNGKWLNFKPQHDCLTKWWLKRSGHLFCILLWYCLQSSLSDAYIILYEMNDETNELAMWMELGKMLHHSFLMWGMIGQEGWHPLSLGSMRLYWLIAIVWLYCYVVPFFSLSGQ